MRPAQRTSRAADAAASDGERVHVAGAGDGDDEAEAGPPRQQQQQQQQRRRYAHPAPVLSSLSPPPRCHCGVHKRTAAMPARRGRRRKRQTWRSADADHGSNNGGNTEPSTHRASIIAPLVRDVFHMTAFGVVGVLARIGLGLLFGPAHGDVTSPTGALFIDLPANAFGSFVLGFVTATGDAFKPRLPRVHAGMATGMCGALTTYASWNQQVVNMFTAGGSNHWLAALFAIALGLEVPLFSYALGLHTELAVRHFLTRRYVLHDSAFAEAHAQYKRSKRRDEERRAQEWERLQQKYRNGAEGASVRNGSGTVGASNNGDEQNGGGDGGGGNIGHRGGDARENNEIGATGSGPLARDKQVNVDIDARAGANAEADIEAVAGAEFAAIANVDDTRPPAECASSKPAAQRGGATQTPAAQTNARASLATRVAHTSAASVDDIAEATARLRGDHDRWGRRHRVTLDADDARLRRNERIEFAVFAAVATALIAAAIVGSVVDTDATRRGYWLSCCISPFGVVLRWQLSVHLNKRLRSLPVGTLTANVVASVVNATLSGALLRIDPSASVATAWVNAVITGFAGSLSTVSTFAGELYRAPYYRWAYMYASVSLTVTVTLGVIAYGVQHWTL